MSLTMALSPAARYGQTFLPPMHQTAIPREPLREPSPGKDANDNNTSDNDGKVILLFVLLTDNSFKSLDPEKKGGIIEL